MAFIVEMVHRKEDCSEPRFYSCHRDTWKQLLTLAKTFGWQPNGSVNANDIDHPTVDYDKYFKPTYDPDEWAYCKAVSKKDAKNIAAALLRADDAIKSGKVAILPTAKSTVFKNSLSEEEFKSMNSSIGQQILQFAQFASQGGFLFAWDDRLEGELFKNRMMNMRDGYYDSMVEKIKEAVLKDGKFSPLVHKVMG